MCVELSEVAYYRGWPTSLGVNLTGIPHSILHMQLVLSHQSTTIPKQLRRQRRDPIGQNRRKQLRRNTNAWYTRELKG
jgi:hypothetical protein